MGKTAADSSSGMLTEKKGHFWLVSFLIRLVKEKPLGAVGLVITLLLLLTGIFADLLAPYGMNETSPRNFLEAPSARFWLGTDEVGRDMLSRLIFGARISLTVGLVGSTISVIISTIIGVLGGYLNGKFDLIVQRVVDAFMCFPGLVLLIIVISLVGQGLWIVIVCLGVVYGIRGSRIVRSAVIGLRENVYVEAAEAIGCSTTRILTRHILPNIMAPIIVLFSIRIPAVIMTEASLSFLGFGIPPPTPSWGGMLSKSQLKFMLQAPWLCLWPGIALATIVYGINMFGDAVRDLLDPRLRGGVGSYSVKARKEAIAKSELSAQQDLHRKL